MINPSVRLLASIMKNEPSDLGITECYLDGNSKNDEYEAASGFDAWLGTDVFPNMSVEQRRESRVIIDTYTDTLVRRAHEEGIRAGFLLAIDILAASGDGK